LPSDRLIRILVTSNSQLTITMCKLSREAHNQVTSNKPRELMEMRHNLRT
jgi:hypothetical protein